MYHIYDPKVNKPLHEVSREVAKKAFAWFLEQRQERIRQATELAALDGWKIRIDAASLEDLHAWFYKQVADTREKSAEVTPFIYSICNDVGIFIGELLVAGRRGLHWQMFTSGKSNISYQRPVISGFNVPNRNYNLDPDRLLCQYAHRIFAGGEFETGFLRTLYESAVSKAHPKGE